MLAECPLVAFAAVSDLERARSFYGGRLGLRLISEQPPFALVFDAHGTTLRVTAVAKLTPAAYTVLGWHVPNTAEAVESLRAAGVTFEHFEGLHQDEAGIWTAPGGVRVAWFKDPDGNVLSVSEG